MPSHERDGSGRGQDGKGENSRAAWEGGREGGRELIPRERGRESGCEGGVGQGEQGRAAGGGRHGRAARGTGTDGAGAVSNSGRRASNVAPAPRETGEDTGTGNAPADTSVVWDPGRGIKSSGFTVGRGWSGARMAEPGWDASPTLIPVKPVCQRIGVTDDKTTVAKEMPRRKRRADKPKMRETLPAIALPSARARP